MLNNVSVKESKKVAIASDVHDFLNPDRVYVPIPEGYKIIIKNNELINKEQAVLKYDDKSIYSPISGRIIGISDSLCIKNQKVVSLVIENDYREHVAKRHGCVKNIGSYTLEEFTNIIAKYNAYDKEINYEAETMIINGVDKDPFEKATSFLIDKYSAQILEAIDAISNILKIDNTILAINNNDSLNVLNLTNNIGTYPNIHLKLVPDIYPIGFKEVLIKNLISKRQEEKGYIYFTVMDIFNIYNALKRQKPKTEKFITLSGDAISENMVVNVKLGSTLNDLIKDCCEIVKENYFVVINGLIAGTTIESLNTIITDDIRSVFLCTRQKEKEQVCINCGLCTNKCPVGLNPKYIKEHRKASFEACLGCGLCTYICPSKINFKKYLNEPRED